MACKVQNRIPVLIDCDGVNLDFTSFNLAYTALPYGGVVTNTGGDDATIPLVNSTNAGLMSPAMLASIKPTLIIEISNLSDGDVINHNLNGNVLVQYVYDLEIQGGFKGEKLNNNNSIFRTPVDGSFSGYLICTKLS
jgi:hypothetical protein